MIFQLRERYGREYFYPIDKKASKFVDAFPGSSGKRKCLTRAQLEILDKISDVNIEDKIVRKKYQTKKKKIENEDQKNGKTKSSRDKNNSS